MKSIRKTKKRNVIDKDELLLKNVVKKTLKNKLISNYSKKIEILPTIKDMKNYALVLEMLTKNDIKKNKSYTPSINNRLESIRSSITHTTDIFGCGAESLLRKTISDNSFYIKIGENNRGVPICVDSTSKKARDVFMKNFKADLTIDPEKIIVPIQRYNNCWFNTMFMCFFVSDKGRKFMRFFRQLMIEGKLADGKLITPKSLSNSFILFNAAIEACYNNNMKKVNWLALNTNNIIVNIYRSIPKIQGIINIKENGNPYNYYSSIMLYLDAKKKSIVDEKLYKDIDIKKFYNSKNTYVNKPDIVLIVLTDSNPSNAQSKNYNKKQKRVNYKGAVYILDSVITRDIDKQHFCCGITCNGEEYIFDGAAFSKLSKRNWSNIINKNYNWNPYGTPARWNFMIGYSMFIYYRIV